jgi:hypothetical protein
MAGGLVIGIDPGLSGAVAALAGSGRVVAVDDTPTFWARSGGSRRRAYDVAAMRGLLARHVVDGALVHAVIEHQQAMPRQGVTSMFSTGFGYGLWVGLLAGLGVPHTVVAPRKWQIVMLAGHGDPKARALLAASRLFPELAIPRRCHGRADALLLAEYGRRILSGTVAAAS